MPASHPLHRICSSWPRIGGKAEITGLGRMSRKKWEWKGVWSFEVPRWNTWSHFVRKKKSILDCPYAPPVSSHYLIHPRSHISAFLLHAAQAHWLLVSVHSPILGNSVGVPGALRFTPKWCSAFSYLSPPAQVPHWALIQPSLPMNGSGNSQCGSGWGCQGGRQPGPALRPGELQSTQSHPSATQTP